MPSFFYEKQYSGIVVGIDEVGCGPWAGPVVAAAVILNQTNFPKELLEMIQDSKKISSKKREMIYQELLRLKEDSCFISWAEASVKEIDALNIRRAAMLAMQRAADSLEIKPEVALVDGNVKPSLECHIQTLVKGDTLSFSIAAASIVAKVVRDEIMCKLAEEYPHYGWERNAGYGTAEHQRAITMYGITPYHRVSFAPIARHVKLLVA
ncbi:ribonuclease HII [Candidatus Paracaedimonas acanthamoebae]|nr:ribonuclease HII [Candidatus Paracaedimonas acanthamoebae]